MRKLLLSALASVTAFSAYTLPASAQDVLIKDATVLTEAGLRKGFDVRLKDGRITGLAPNLSAPEGSTIIAAKGQWVTPPLFAPMSTLGLVEIGSVDSTNDSRAAESETSVSEKASDSYNPRSVHIANVRRRGVGYAAISPNSSGHSIFAGTGMIAKLDGDLFGRHDTDAFIRLDLGETGTRRAGGSRAAAMQQLRAALGDAAAYPARYGSPEDGDVLSRQDAAALAQAARGRIPLIIGAHRASDLVSLIRLKQDYPRLDLIILGAAESWQVADELKAANIKLIIDPLDNLPTQFEKTGSRIDLVTFLDKAGVDFAIGNLTSLGVAQASLLNQHAGNAVAEGLSWEKAFAAVSRVPARWFGMGGTRMSQGQSASLVIWDGDPLEVMSAPTHMWLGGAPQSLESRQTKLRDRYNPTNSDQRPHKYR